MVSVKYKPQYTVVCGYPFLSLLSTVSLRAKVTQSCLMVRGLRLSVLLCLLISPPSEL